MKLEAVRRLDSDHRDAKKKEKTLLGEERENRSDHVIHSGNVD